MSIISRATLIYIPQLVGQAAENLPGSFFEVPELTIVQNYIDNEHCEGNSHEQWCMHDPRSTSINGKLNGVLRETKSVVTGD